MELISRSFSIAGDRSAEAVCEDVSKPFATHLYGQNDVLQSYDLPVTLTRHTCPHYFADAGAGVGAGAGAARYLSNQRTMAANIS